MAQSFPAVLTRYPGRTLFIFIVIALILGEIVGWPFLRAPAERFMSDYLERSVRLDQPFQVRFIGGIRLKAGGLWISAPEGFDAPHLINAKNIELHLRYGDLLDTKINKGQAIPLRIKTLLVEDADVYLIRHADGKSTWQFNKENEPSHPIPAIENLVVPNGKAIIQDPLTESDLKVDFSTKEGSNNLAATSKVEAQGKFREIPLKAELATDGLLPIAVQNKTAAPLNSKGWVDYGGVHVDFNGSVSDIFGKKNIKGKFSAQGPSLSTLGLLVNVLLPTTAPFKLQGNIEKSDNVWDADISSARISKSELYGHFKYDPRPDVPMLEGTLKGKRFFLADLAPAFGASVEGTRDDTPDRIFPDRPLDLPSLNRMNAHVTVDLDYVEIGKAFNKPIAPFKAELDLNNSLLSLTKISAKTADGSLSGMVSVDAHQVADKQNINKKSKEPSELPEWRMDMQWKDIQLEKWLQVSKDRKDAAAKEGKKIPPAYVTGMLNGKTNLAGKGNSTAQLLGSLNGDVSIYIHQGAMSHLIIEALGLDVAQALGVMMKGDELLPMQCAVMNLKAKQGIASPDVALVYTPVTLILMDGNIDLAHEKWGVRLIAKPKNVSPFTVRSPILVKGTFVNPVISAQSGPIAARVVGAVALAFINPLASILPFIDTGSRDEHSSCSQALAEFNKASTGKASDKAAVINTR